MRRRSTRRCRRRSCRRATFRGDLQMHSTWSDGGETHRDDGRRRPRARARRASAITDHSYGLPIAQRHEHGGGRRSSIGRSTRSTSAARAGSASSKASRPTSSPTARSICSRTSAACSSSWSPRRTRCCGGPTDQTARMLGRGRAARRRDPRPSAGPDVQQPAGRVGATGARVFARPPKRGVAIEIDGNWHRQDIDYELARAARSRPGCLFALDSDAHCIARAALHRLRHRARAARRRSRRSRRQLLEQRAARGVDGGAREAARRLHAACA